MADMDALNALALETVPPEVCQAQAEIASAQQAIADAQATIDAAQKKCEAACAKHAEKLTRLGRSLKLLNEKEAVLDSGAVSGKVQLGDAMPEKAQALDSIAVSEKAQLK